MVFFLHTDPWFAIVILLRCFSSHNCCFFNLQNCCEVLAFMREKGEWGGRKILKENRNRMYWFKYSGPNKGIYVVHPVFLGKRHIWAFVVGIIQSHVLVSSFVHLMPLLSRTCMFAHACMHLSLHLYVHAENLES